MNAEQEKFIRECELHVGSQPYSNVLRLVDIVRDVEKVKDGAYDERNRLVAALSRVFPSSLERHPEVDKTWEDDWRWIVFVDLPTGQASWHIHDSHLPLFSHLPRHQGREWDGHSTELKYQRLEQFCVMPNEQLFEEALKCGNKRYSNALKELANEQTN
jgi:hypothetical protein